MYKAFMSVNMNKDIALYQQQPYDNTLKALFEESTGDMLEFAAGRPVEQVTELSGEVLKPPLRIDRGYEGWYEGRAHVVHVELETDSKGEIVFRMLEYFGILYRKHKKPVLSIVIYPYRTAGPNPSFQVHRDDESIFYFRILKLWEIEAQSFMEQWRANMYAMVPTMQGADYTVLSYALDAMKQFYANQRRTLASKLMLFDVLLRRSDMVSEEDRSRIMQKMGPYVDLLEESPYMQKARAEGEAEGEARGKVEGKAEGKAEGRMEMLQDNILKIVRARFPRLTKVARQKVRKVTELEELDELFNELLVAADERAARLAFEDLES